VVALQVPQASQVATQEEQRAAAGVLLAAALLSPPLRLVQPLQAALEGSVGKDVLLSPPLRLMTLAPQAALKGFLGAAAPQPRRLVQAEALLSPPLRLMTLAPQAASSRKAERAWAAPGAHICLLGKPQHMGSKRIYVLDTPVLLQHPLRRHCG
jgi:hypothetical protein